MLADQLKNILQTTREGLGNNFDQQDPEFISLREELERLFNKKNLTQVTKKEMEENIGALNKINKKSRELERRNQLLKAKYDNDEKYVRLHKRLMEKEPLTNSDKKLFSILSNLKSKVDNQIEKNTQVLLNENYVNRMFIKLIVDQFQDKIIIDPTTIKNINGLLAKEYLNEYHCQMA